MSGAPRTGRERGSALLELLIAALLLMVAMAIAHGLLVECLRIFSSSARELRQPDRTLVLRQLRLDLTAAEPGRRAPYWSGEPLALRSGTGWALWGLDGERLTRELLAPDGSSLGQRPMLDGVVAFQWRAPVAGLVEVEILRRAPRGDSALRAGTSAWRPRDQRLESASIVAASRLGRSW